jgi:hypothetical protein
MSGMFVCSQLPTPCHFVALHEIKRLLPIIFILLQTSVLVLATFFSQTLCKRVQGSPALPLSDATS